MTFGPWNADNPDSDPRPKEPGRPQPVTKIDPLIAYKIRALTEQNPAT
jgi:hypothetical protein